VTLDDPSVRLRGVAVGHTRDAAAAAFGTDHDNVFLTSFDDFAREVDLAEVTTLDIVPGDGMAPVLEAASRELHTGRDLTIRLAAPHQDHTRLADLVERCAIQINEVHDLAGSVVLTLGRRGQRRAGGDELVLRALQASEASTTVPSTIGPAVPAADALATSSEPAPASSPRPVPKLVEVLQVVRRWSEDAHSRLVALGLLAVTVVLLVAMGVWTSQSRVAVAVAVPVLLAVCIATSAFACYVVLLLANQVHDQTRRLRRMVVGNRKLVQNRTSTLDERMQALEDEQSRLPFARDYLEAIAQASSEASTRLRDLVDALEAMGIDPETLVAPVKPVHLEAVHTVGRSRPSQ
jgi:hypothetical protein